LQRKAPAAARFDLGGDALGSLTARIVNDGGVGAALGQFERDGAADARLPPVTNAARSEKSSMLWFLIAATQPKDDGIERASHEPSS
jgi:hypothetical protein